MIPAPRQSPKKLSIIITAGPTREKIDPVRFISNYSTGTFGYELAEEARRRGNKVTLISGPTALKTPGGVKFIAVESASDMRYAVLKEFKKADCVIMAAAVSDWRVRHAGKQKIKKGSGPKVLELIGNPDILAELGKQKGKKILVGFALETEALERNAIRKLKEKNLDMIIANKFSSKNNVFGDSVSTRLMIDRFGGRAVLGRKSKRGSAKIILDKVLSFNI